jgi:hypothetical protein
MAAKIATDVHVFGKSTIILYRQLFSFTNCLLMYSSQKRIAFSPDMFADMYTFLSKLGGPASDQAQLPLDFGALPQLLFNNLNSWPKLFKQIYPETYFMQDIDLHSQLAASVSIIMDRRIKNPHMRIEFVNFLHHLVPQKKVNSHHEKQN